jgi:hypothetical protein
MSKRTQIRGSQLVIRYSGLKKVDSNKEAGDFFVAFFA